MQHLLYLPHRIPYPPDKGDKIRAWHVLRYLQRHFHVHLGTFVDCADDWQHMALLRASCASSRFVPLRPWLARLRSLRGLASAQPLSLPYYRDRQLAIWVRRTLADYPIAATLALSGPMGQYLPAQGPRGPLLRVMDLVDVDSEKWAAYAAGRRWPASWLYRREARLLLAGEQRLARQFDRVTLVSEAEAALFRLRAPAQRQRIDHFNNGVDARYFSPSPGHASPYPPGQTVLVFTGAMDYWPNIDAVLWFASRVLPTLRARQPELHFHIVGARPAASVRALAAMPGVHVSGTVPDIRPYLQHAALAVAPLRIARGVQNKVLEAMAMQTIVVASHDALQGIAAAPGVEVIAAADEREFIARIGQVLAGQAPLGMALAARRCILQHYDWDSNLARLGHMLGVAEPVTERAS